MGIVIEKKNVVGHVDIVPKTGEAESIPVPMGVVEALPATVGLKIGYTQNLGNFESVRIDISLYMPCEATEDGANSTFAFIENWVEQKMGKVINELEKK